MQEKNFDQEFEEQNPLIKKYENAQKNNEYIFLNESDLEEIVDFYLDGQNFEKALLAAEDGIEQYQFSDTFYCKKAEVLIEIQQLNEAAENLDKAEALAPNQTHISLLRADIYLNRSQYVEAVECIEAAINYTTKDEKADLYLELADVYEEWEKYYEVIDTLKICLQYAPNNEEALHRLWFSIELTEKYHDSIEFHQELLESHPYNMLAWYNLGHAYCGLHLYEKAIDAFEYGIAIDENYEILYIDCAEAHFKLGNFEKAIDLFTDGIEKGASKKEVYYNIGKCYDKLQNKDKAREFYKKSIAIDPYFAKAFHKIGQNFLEVELPENAVSNLERAVKIDNRNQDYLRSLAQAYLHLDHLEKAENLYRVILKTNQLDKQIHLDLAAVLYEKGETREALEHLDDTISLFDDDKSLLYIKTVFLLELGNRTEAIATLTIALLEDPKGIAQFYKMLPSIKDDETIMKLINQLLN